MATERIQIIISETGAVTVKKNVADIGPAAKSSASAVDQLKGALGAYIGLQAAQKIGELADAGTRLTNSLKQAGLSGQGLLDEQNKLFDLATANGQNVNQLAGIYQKLSSVQGQLGASGKDVDKVLTGIAASMKLSSAGAEAQAGSLQQLSQLFGGVNVQAQEYNSLIDGAYPLLQAVASGSDRFSGSVSKLTQAVKSGSVTTKEFFEALAKGSDANIALAASFNVTIGQALTNFNTKLIQLVLNINQSTGAFTAVALTINFAAQNLGVLLALLSPIIAGFTLLAVQIIGGYFITAISAATTAVGGLITQLSRLLLFLLANPAIALFVGLTAAIATIITLTGGWEKTIQAVIDAINGAIRAVKNLLTLFGATFTDGQFEIKVTGEELVGKFNKAANDIKAALPSGADQAAPKLRKGVADGGDDAARALKAGTADGAQRIYEALNGVVLKFKGEIQAGSDYMYNQVTGAITKSSDYGANSMKTAIEAGGNNAAASISAAVSAAAREATIQMNQAAAAAASAFSGRTSIDLGLGFIPGGSGSGSGNYRQYDSHTKDDRADNYRKTYTSDAGGGGGGSIPTGLGNNANGGLTINNVIDPASSLQAIDTQQGNRTIVNTIKGNSSEIKQILGIV